MKLRITFITLLPVGLEGLRLIIVLCMLCTLAVDRGFMHSIHACPVVSCLKSPAEHEMKEEGCGGKYCPEGIYKKTLDLSCVSK